MKILFPAVALAAMLVHDPGELDADWFRRRAHRTLLCAAGRGLIAAEAKYIDRARHWTKLAIREVSLCDRGAGEGCTVELVKRDSDAPPHPFQSREQALQKLADLETAQAMQKAVPTGRPETERDAYLRRLYTVAKRAEPVEPAPAAPPATNTAYQRLEAMAKRAAETDPTMSEAQHFAHLAELHPDLFQKAKALPQDDNDDGDDQTGDDDDGDDDDPPGGGNGDEIGPKPTPAEARTNDGRSRGGPYDGHGSNVRQYPKDAPRGSLETSYDPAKRPASARKSELEAAKAELDKREREVAQHAAAIRAFVSGVLDERPAAI